MREYKWSEETNAKRSISMLGKNCKNGSIPRPQSVTLVSPSGKIYENIINIKKFAKEHNLDQRSLNHVARGLYVQHKGWYLLGTMIIPKIPLRLDIRSPDGTVYYGVTDFDSFGIEHNIPANKLKKGIQKRFTHVGLGDGLGHAWHVNNSVPRYTFKYKKTGEIFGEIVETQKFADFIGIPETTMQTFIRTGCNNRTIEMVERFTPNNHTI